MMKNTPSGKRLNLAELAYNQPYDVPEGWPAEPPGAPQFVPQAGFCYALVFASRGMYVIEPSARFPGYFFVSKIREDSESVDFTKKPIPADWVEAELKRHGLERPTDHQWVCKESAGVLAPLDSFPGALA